MANDWLTYCKSFIPKIKAKHKQMLGRESNLAHPRRFTDKLEWLKVYDSTFLKTYCSDKLTARKYVAAKLGKDISIPLLGVYDKFDDIDFSNLPQNYVIKTNHGSHTNIIVRNGKIDKVTAKAKFDSWMSTDWSWYGYELHYIPIPRRILIEKYVTDGHTDLTDYKFWCFNGRPKLCQVISDRTSTTKHANYYDMDWVPCKYITRDDLPSNYDLIDSVPYTFSQMIKYATALARPFKFVRVDFYEINCQLYFGELTFVPAAAYMTFSDDTVDYLLGDWLQL